MGAVGPDRMSSRGFTAAYLLAVAVVVGIQVASPERFRPLVYAATVSLPLITIPIGVRSNRIGRPLPWYMLALGTGLSAASSAVPAVGTLAGPVPGGYLAAGVLDLVAYVGVLAAAAVLVAQQAPRDAGRVIDAALVGMCGAGMLWEWVLRSHLSPGYRTPAGKISALVATLALIAILGSLLQVLRTATRARAPLALMFVALSVATLGRMLDQLGYAGGRSPFLWSLCWVSLAAAALHPAARYLTVPTWEQPDPVTSGRLLRLGLILAVVPLIGGVPQLFGQPPDGLLLTVGVLATIPLVLIRVGQLARQRTEAQHALIYQAAHDELTGLPNRRAVLEQLDRAVAQFNTGGMNPVTVLFCDLDGFKSINDQLGHQIGDEVLRIAALRLRNCLRSSDLVGRFGGDEFLVVRRHADGDDLVSRIERVFDDPLTVSHGTVTLGVSVGVARTTAGTPTTSDALVAAADEAMYRVKRARRAAAH